MSGGSNLPPGVTESMIPGNRPEDRAWDRAVQVVAEDYDIVWAVCKENRASCEHAQYDDALYESLGASEAFIGCSKHVVHANGKISCDTLECPYVTARVERLVDEIMYPKV